VRGTPIEIPLDVNRSWIAGAVCVVVCASFVARAAAHAIEARYFAEPKPAATPPKTVAPPQATSESGISANVLVDRNPFCSDCRAQPGAGDPTPSTTIAVPKDLVLVAVMRGPRDFAAIRNASSGAQGAYAVGERVPGGGTIEEIAGTHVMLRLDAGLARLDFPSDDPVADAALDTPVTAPTTTKPDPYADRVKKLSDTSYEIDRTLLGELMTSGGKGVPGVRVGPAYKDGKLSGVRVSRAGKGSLAESVGLRTGDVVEAIDGMALDDINKSLEAMGKLRTAASVRLSLVRGGKPVEIDYRLR
jgi:general secretion pathway protein C